MCSYGEASAGERCHGHRTAPTNACGCGIRTLGHSIRNPFPHPAQLVPSHKIAPMPFSSTTVVPLEPIAHATDDKKATKESDRGLPREESPASLPVVRLRI